MSSPSFHTLIQIITLLIGKNRSPSKRKLSVETEEVFGKQYSSKRKSLEIKRPKIYNIEGLKFERVELIPTALKELILTPHSNCKTQCKLEDWKTALEDILTNQKLSTNIQFKACKRTAFRENSRCPLHIRKSSWKGWNCEESCLGWLHQWPKEAKLLYQRQPYDALILDHFGLINEESISKFIDNYINEAIIIAYLLHIEGKSFFQTS